MALPNNADIVVVWGYWFDEATRAGVAGTVTFDPVPLNGDTEPNVRDFTEHGWIKTRPQVAVPDPDSGFFAVQVVASNDPDLDAYGGRRVTFSGETPFVIEVPYNAPTVTVSAEMAAATGLLEGDVVRGIPLVDAAVVSAPPPQPPSAYMTSTQTLATIADMTWAPRGAWSEGVAYLQREVVTYDGSAWVAVADNLDVVPGTDPVVWVLVVDRGEPGPANSLAIGSVSTLDTGQAATASISGDAPAQTLSLGLPRGDKGDKGDKGDPGAGSIDSVNGDLGPDVVLDKADVGLGNVDNTSDADKPVSTAQQAAIDAAAAVVPEQARDALAAALVGGANITVTVDDTADTIAISGSAAYSDEQAQDAIAALFEAGTHSGISFTYDDTGNAISASVPSGAPAGTASLRALGAGATQAAAGNDARLSDTRTPTDGSVTNAKVASSAAIAESKLSLASDAVAGTASRRTLGTGATQAAAGNHKHAGVDITSGTVDYARLPVGTTSGSTVADGGVAGRVTALEYRNPTDLGYARMVQRGTQHTPNQANTLIQFNTELFSTAHVTHTSTTTYTIVTTGLYLLDGKIGYANSTTTTCVAWIGTPDFVTARWAESSVGFTIATTPSVVLATTAYLAAGTQVTLGVYNYAELDVANAYDVTHLAVTLLRSA